MAKEELKAKTTVGEGEAAKIVHSVVKFDIDTLLNKVGAEVERRQAKVACRVDIQAVQRSGIKAGKSDTDIQKDVDKYLPGEKRRSMTKAEKLKKEFEKLPKDQQSAMLAALSG